MLLPGFCCDEVGDGEARDAIKLRKKCDEVAKSV